MPKTTQDPPLNTPTVPPPPLHPGGAPRAGRPDSDHGGAEEHPSQAQLIYYDPTWANGPTRCRCDRLALAPRSSPAPLAPGDRR